MILRHRAPRQAGSSPIAGIVGRREVLIGALATIVVGCSSSTDRASTATGTGAGPGTTGTDATDSSMPAPRPMPQSVVMVGDSITALAQPTLQTMFTEIGVATATVNAEYGRRIEDATGLPLPGVDVIEYINGVGPPQLWVIALGANDVGVYTQESDFQRLIDDTLAAVTDAVPLLWVNVYHGAHLEACEQLNGLLSKTLGDRADAGIADWYTQCATSTAMILEDDGVHPNSAGILVFTNTVHTAIAARYQSG